MQLVPCIILVIATIMIILKLSSARKRKMALKNSSNDSSDQTANALLAILILFLICELPQTILLTLLIFDSGFKIVLWNVYKLLYMLRLLNASLNFILYCTMSSLFRSTFREVIGGYVPCLKKSTESRETSKKSIESIEMSK